MSDCPLCCPVGEQVLWETPQLRVIAVHDEANAPAFCRVIWREHIAEMSDLPPADRATLMDTVFRVETAMRQVLRPTKINLASLGNVVPHLHWHIIARFADDACFPAPVWAQAVRAHGTLPPDDWAQQVAALLNHSET